MINISTGFNLRARFLLASFIPTLIVITMIVSLFVMQFNRLVIQEQIDDLLTIPPILKKQSAPQMSSIIST